MAAVTASEDAGAHAGDQIETGPGMAGLHRRVAVGPGTLIGVDQLAALRELLGTSDLEELIGGHQSRVYAATLPGEAARVVVKVRPLDEVEEGDLRTRMQVVAELAAVEPLVCRPFRLDGQLVLRLEGDAGWRGFATCVEHVGGLAPDPSDGSDATAMGASLARLHLRMADLGPVDLPLVAALRSTEGDLASAVQLLHGDFGAGNLRRTPAGLRIFDFDDCGYGPPLFDVANAVYMVRFDDETSGDGRRHQAFEASFLRGYAEESGDAVDRSEVSRLMDLRVEALAAWLDDLSAAPVGIRTASPAWRQVLRGFVDTWRRDERS
ncbi:hypothetical protein BH24ACT4_BH24ACT4_06440 [soil metagenome]